MPSEFDIIKHFFTQANLVPPAHDVRCVLGVGDDCALLDVAREALAVSVDTLVEDVHFPVETPASVVGYRALAVNVSDLAAMGAMPAYFTLALTLPWADEQWLSDFAQGLAEAAKLYGIYLVGGDTTRGPLSITIQVMGHVPAKQALKRSGAKAGDIIYVTGSLGDAVAGLHILQQLLDVEAQHADFLVERFCKPRARVDVGLALRGIANSAIDVSDGLLADLSHIVAASGVRAIVNAQCIPQSPALRAVVDQHTALTWALTAGDDYELCFTVPRTQTSHIQNVFINSDVAITAIGEIKSGAGVVCIDEHQQPMTFTAQGFRHF